ncbi:MAG: D-2-hydroxyacid dehydrogenase, partial [Oscillospiraceae bacterium]|nr:D-2-hydroxyacid dehydrogenase [Oscillospiraceae bacterium]
MLQCANLPETQNLLNGNLFKLMKKNATFINTGRGAQVVEADLIEALKTEPNRTAVLDVTMPEPPEENHPFYSMENV